MISRENYTEEHIRFLQDKYRRDPGLIERTLFAFGLLEALVSVGLEFIFKGGTSLMLLLEEPMRFSTDIDIVVRPGTDIDEYILKAKMIFPFIDGGEQTRNKSGNIEKRHFKFIYSSPVKADETLYILLDVLFEENHYEKLTIKEIKNDLLVTEGENLSVTVPTIDCVLGDKLTAFAPHTTGIKFGMKNLEVMKQFFDISTLINEFSDFECVRKTYFSVSENEIRYRNIVCTPKDALLDTIRSAMCICSRGKIASEDFQYLLDGTRKIQNHIFAYAFSMEKASRMAPKIIYMAVCLMSGERFEFFNEEDDFSKASLVSSDMKPLKVMKKADPAGYGYLVKADRILCKY